MAAGIIDFTIEEGATFYRVLTVQTPGTPEIPSNPSMGIAGTPAVPAVPIPLTGYTARASIRANFSSSAPVIADFVCTIISEPEGKIGIMLDAATTTDILADADRTPTSEPTEIGFFDLEIVHTSGFVTRLLRGKILFSDEITR